MLSRSIKISILNLLVVFAAGSVWAQATINSMDQNADQSQGQYQPMDMGYAGFNSLGMMQSAWLDPLQNLGEGQTKPAYSKYYWSPDLVLPLRLREGMITLLNFPEWEMIEDIYIGDNATFDGQISGPNTLLLYPRKGANVGVDTNIIVFGRSGNRYVFYVRSEGVNTERLTNAIVDIDVIDGAGNGGNLGSGGNGAGGHVNASKYLGAGGKSADSTFTKRFQKNDWIKNIPLDPSKFRFDMEIYVPNPDDVVIAPERVWRDDIFTYIDLGAKALNMTQRPIVTLIVERIEVPVGFRTTGPNNRLIIVEAIGDMVLRNGKRIVCIKMRRSDDVGMENITYADTDNEWNVPAPLPDRRGNTSGAASGNAAMYGNGSAGAGGRSGRNVDGQFDINVGSGELIVPEYGNGQNGANGGINISYNADGSINYDGNGGGQFDYSKMHRIKNTQKFDSAASSLASQYRYGSGFSDNGSNISIELGTDANVDNLESLWESLSTKYSKILKNYDPFFSVDTPADGQGKELFHLRIGPVKTLDEGDSVCSKLGRNGVFCSVVRTQ